MLHEVVVMFEEIAAEMAHEVTAFPVRMAAEVIQFVLLGAIVWIVAVGWGKRRGFVANMLSERAEKTARDIEAASHATTDLEEATRSAAERLEAAKSEARRLVEAARADAEQLEAAARSEATAEAARTIERAQAALATETEEMHAELREQLVSIVAQATRAILSEKMSVAEQRTAIEGAIATSIGATAVPNVDGNGARGGVRKRSAAHSGAAT